VIDEGFEREINACEKLSSFMQLVRDAIRTSDYGQLERAVIDDGLPNVWPAWAVAATNAGWRPPEGWKP
jgi:hypothetical protein